MEKPFLPVALGVVLLTAVGCGQTGPARYEVSGKIVLKDKPLDQGIIQFWPLDKQTTSATANLEKDGSYRVARANGLFPGKYKVTIASGDAPEELGPDEAPGPGKKRSGLGKERVPPEYNVKSDKTVEVTSGGPNKFDFTIK